MRDVMEMGLDIVGGPRRSAAIPKGTAAAAAVFVQTAQRSFRVPPDGGLSCPAKAGKAPQGCGGNIAADGELVHHAAVMVAPQAVADGPPA